MQNPKFNVKFTGYRLRHPEIALQRVAYLLAFSKFGYEFLVNPGLFKVREQINNPDKEVLPHFGGIMGNFDTIPNGYYILTEPKEVKSFLVVFQLRQRKHCFLLPGPDHPGIGIYDEMSKLLEQKGKLDFNVKHIMDAPFITEESYVLAPIDLFDNA